MRKIGTVIMQFKQVILVSLLSFLLNTAFAKDDRNNSREVDAAIEMLTAKYDIEFNYQFCRDRAGSYSYKYDYIHYIWELKNRTFLQLSENIFGNLPAIRINQLKQHWQNSKEKMLSDRTSTDNEGNGKYCAQYFSHVLDGTIDKLDIPKENLTPKLGSIEDARILQRNIDMEVGCIKQGYNSDVKQFGAVKKACNCTVSLTLRKMSNQEVDEYLTLASGKNPQDALNFVRKRISDSEIQSCHM